VPRISGNELSGRKHVNCAHRWVDAEGHERQCNYNVFGNDPEEAYNNLLESRKSFLSFGVQGLNCKGRRQMVYDKLTVPCEAGAQSLHDYTTDVWCQVGNRRVCKAIFNLAFPVSESTLNRLIEMRRCGIGPNDPDRLGQVESEERGAKSLYIIAWWRRYAESTAERLPDSPGLMTPRRHLVAHTTHPPLSSCAHRFAE
jgi:hypothetical protein